MFKSRHILVFFSSLWRTHHPSSRRRYISPLLTPSLCDVMKEGSVTVKVMGDGGGGDDGDDDDTILVAAYRLLYRDYRVWFPF